MIITPLAFHADLLVTVFLAGAFAAVALLSRRQTR
jgi:hypothetical protein